MTRAGIAVQLASERKAHSVAFLQIRDLLIGQRLDRAAFHPGVGLLLLGPDGAIRCFKCHDASSRQQPKGDQSSLHDSASIENPYATLAPIHARARDRAWACSSCAACPARPFSGIATPAAPPRPERGCSAR